MADNWWEGLLKQPDEQQANVAMQPAQGPQAQTGGSQFGVDRGTSVPQPQSQSQFPQEQQENPQPANLPPLPGYNLQRFRPGSLLSLLPGNNNGQQLVSPRPANMPADVPHIQARVKELQDAGMQIVARQDLSDEQKQGAMARVTAELEQLDPEHSYRRGGAQTPAQKFWAQNVHTDQETGTMMALGPKGPVFHNPPKDNSAHQNGLDIAREHIELLKEKNRKEEAIRKQEADEDKEERNHLATMFQHTQASMTPKAVGDEEPRLPDPSKIWDRVYEAHDLNTIDQAVAKSKAGQKLTPREEAKARAAFMRSGDKWKKVRQPDNTPQVKPPETPVQAQEAHPRSVSMIKPAGPPAAIDQVMQEQAPRQPAFRGTGVPY
jgi:hypothetical protein